MSPILVTYLIAAVFGAVIAGFIAYGKSQSGTTATVYAVMGAAVPIVGVIAAFFVKEPPRPPGWYLDPWNPRMVRWYDGYQWTWHSQPA